MSNTTHISRKKNEGYLKAREKELSKVLRKNISDTYKYSLNRTYLQIMEKVEDGQPEYIC